MADRWGYEKVLPALTLQEWAEAVGLDLESRTYDDRETPLVVRRHRHTLRRESEEPQPI